MDIYTRSFSITYFYGMLLHGFLVPVAGQAFEMRYPLLWCCGLVITALALSIFIPVVNNDLYIVFWMLGRVIVYISVPDEKHILIDGGKISIKL